MRRQLAAHRGRRAFPTADKLISPALADIKVAAIDLDGVVYRGNVMIGGADEAISRLRQQGLRPLFATNSSVRTRADIARKLSGMGIPAREDEILSSAFVAAMLVRELGSRRVLVIGSEGLRREMADAGAMVVPEPPCDVVVVGMDTAFSYGKIQMAAEAIASGAVFVACNRDASFPGENGRILPGCGPMVAAVEAAAGSPPHFIAGKPAVRMLEIIAAQYQVNPREILVVGDGLDSDIEMGTAFGSPSVLVAPVASEWNPETLGPTWTLRSLADLPALLGMKAGF